MGSCFTLSSDSRYEKNIQDMKKDMKPGGFTITYAIFYWLHRLSLVDKEVYLGTILEAAITVDFLQ